MTIVSDVEEPSYKTALKKGLGSGVILLLLPLIFEIPLLFTDYTLLPRLPIFYLLLGIFFLIIGSLTGWLHASPTLMLWTDSIIGRESKIKTQKHAEVKLISNVAAASVCFVASIVISYIQWL